MTGCYKEAAMGIKGHIIQGRDTGKALYDPLQFKQSRRQAGSLIRLQFSTL